MADVGSLVVRIAADAGELHREFTRAGKAGKDFGDIVGQSGKTVALTLAAAAASAVVLVQQIAAQAEATQNLAQITGLSTTRVQEYDAILKRAGGSAQDLTQGTRTLSMQLLAAADGSQEARRAFSRLGLDASKIAKDTDQGFTAVIEKLSAMPPGFERTAIAAQLLGRGVATLLPAFAQGSEEFKRITQEAREFGAILSGPQLDALNKADDAFDRLALATGGFAKQLAVILAPAVTTIINDLATLTGKATQLFGLFAPPTAFEDARRDLERFRDELHLTDEDINKMAVGVQLVGRGAGLEQLSPSILAAEAAKAQQALSGAAAVKWDAEGLRLYIQGLVSMGNEALAAMEKQKKAVAELDAQQRTLREAEAHNITMTIQRQEAATQKEVEALMQREADMQAMLDRDIAAHDAAEMALGQFTQDRLNREFQASQKVASFWDLTAKSIQDGFAFTWGQITNQLSNALATQLVMGNDWARTLQALSISVLQGFITLGIQALAHWVVTEHAKTAVSLAADAARTASTTAAAATSTAVVGAAAAAQAGIMGGLASSAIDMLLAVWTMTKAVFAALAAAAKSTVFGIPIGVAITAALIAGAVLVASASKEAAAVLGAAAAGTAALTFLEHGGIVTRPTLSVLGERPEAVIPLEKMRHLNMGQEIVIHNYLQADGREFARITTRYLPRSMRWVGAPI